MSPVSETSEPFALVLTATRVQNKLESSTRPESAGNLHRVSEYPLGSLGGFYCSLSTVSHSLLSPALQWEKKFCQQKKKSCSVFTIANIRGHPLSVTQTSNECDLFVTRHCNHTD